jgi:hypothetical protein
MGTKIQVAANEKEIRLMVLLDGPQHLYQFCVGFLPPL